MIDIGAALGVFFLLTLLGQEIFVSMAAGAAALILTQQLDLDNFQIVPQTMLYGIEGLELAAIPLFVLAGELMNAGGITSRLVTFSRALIGHIRGGLSMVAVMVNILMAGVSGSAVADASSTGTVLIPAMKADGYDPDYAAALVASAATIGPIIPPSIPMIIYAILASQSVAQLFLGGLLPGVLMGLALMVYCYVVAVRRNYPRQARSSVGTMLRAFVSAFLAVLMPGFIVVGVVFGFATVTEVAGIAVGYAAVVGGLVYRELRLRDLPRILGASAVLSAVILITLATANTFAYFLTLLQIGPKLLIAVTALSTDPMVVLLLINVVLLLVGCVFEPLPAMLVFVPILMPLVKSLGIDLVFFGVIVVFNLMLGLLTPPVGLNFFVTATIAKRPPEAVVAKLWPMFLVLLLVLIVCTLFPAIVLWLPHALS